MTDQQQEQHILTLAREYVACLMDCMAGMRGAANPLFGPAQNAADRFLENKDTITRMARKPYRAPGCRWLPSAMKDARKLAEQTMHGSRFSELIEIIEIIDPLTDWIEGYSPATVDRQFLENFTFTSIVGPDCLVESEEISAGITLIGANTYYAWHAHPAVEIYLCLSEASEWGLNNESMKAVSFGEVISHPSLAAHAMRTTKVPLLAPWIWYGDISEPAIMI